ncbi:HNH endonuclease [Homoserinimonas aerilata]|nr:HNH endonuclease [Homoserinimonas aerilata]
MRDGAHSVHNVHRLVAFAFIGAPTGPVVRHLDGNPDNNAVTNLAFGTVAENNRDTIRHGRNVNASRKTCTNGHDFDDANTYIRPSGARTCRACNRDAAARVAARRKGLAA